MAPDKCTSAITIGLGVLCSGAALGYGLAQAIVAISDGPANQFSRDAVYFAPYAPPAHWGRVSFAVGIVEAGLCIAVMAPIGITATVLAFEVSCPV